MRLTLLRNTDGPVVSLSVFLFVARLRFVVKSALTEG